MTPQALLHHVYTLGVRLVAHGERLQVDAPKGTVTPVLLDAMRTHKAALLALLELWEERAAIMEYAGGLAREDAEWQAFQWVLERDTQEELSDV